MAEIVLSNCKIFMAEFDLSGKLNAVAIDSTPDMLDNTHFGHTSKSRKKGLDMVMANIQGFWDTEADDVIMTDVGVVNVPLTLAPISGAEGERAYSFLCQVGEYNLGGSVGELLKFTGKAESSGQQLISGNIIHNAVRASTGNGTSFQLGAIGATQKMYAALHVYAASVGDTLDVKIQSDDNGGFSSPTDRITFAQKAVIGYEWLTLNGPITDTYWRVVYTIGGAGPSFTFAVFAGIK